MAAVGSVGAEISTAKSLKYRAKVEERNAAIDRAAAQDALKRGRIEEERVGRRTAQLIGQQRAAAAANGVEVDFGSMGDLQEDTRMLGFEDAQTVRENAARESRGYEINAWNRQASASASRSQASATMWSTAFDAGGQLLSAGAAYKKARTPMSMPQPSYG